jgi:hypothetical protein
VNKQLLEELGQSVEKSMEEMREKISHRTDSANWLNCHTSIVPIPSNYDIAQAYLLLKILDRLESIDDSLIVLMSGKERS